MSRAGRTLSKQRWILATVKQVKQGDDSIESAEIGFFPSYLARSEIGFRV